MNKDRIHGIKHKIDELQLELDRYFGYEVYRIMETNTIIEMEKHRRSFVKSRDNSVRNEDFEGLDMAVKSYDKAIELALKFQSKS